ncbi:MAG TPA: hypothetical protein V6C81_31555 [Planktothrix sp.]|jgi:DNA mismatch repair ATPase MutS
MHRENDFALGGALWPNYELIARDLELNFLIGAMSGGDDFVSQVAREALLSGSHNDLESMLYRQSVLRDCLQNSAFIKKMYELSTDFLEKKKENRLGIFSHTPSGVVRDGTKFLRYLIDCVATLKQTATGYESKFKSEGFSNLFSVLSSSLSDDFISRVTQHLQQLEFDDGILVSAELGEGNQGINYMLHKSGKSGFLPGVFARKSSAQTFRVDPRDDAGARNLGVLRDRGLYAIANALGRSCNRILNFFHQLRTELAFYVGCINLHRKLCATDSPLCFPICDIENRLPLSAVNLCNANLALKSNGVVSNSFVADGKKQVLITGCNQGGKTIFLQSIGVAQLMMQSGMFVVAESFVSDFYQGVFTHFRREEDATMASGKFDEELLRMSEIVDMLAPNSLLLFNESFAATNEREGSVIANEVITAILTGNARILFVTHFYEYARRVWENNGSDAVLFLRAERRSNGERTFKLMPGEPLPTSFGTDLHAQIYSE